MRRRRREKRRRRRRRRRRSLRVDVGGSREGELKGKVNYVKTNFL